MLQCVRGASILRSEFGRTTAPREEMAAAHTVLSHRLKPEIAVSPAGGRGVSASHLIHCDYFSVGFSLSPRLSEALRLTGP
jgi:hypothetical protein